ncbi:MAG: patatin-like phospholipase family protein [Armatimonadota bacterium]|nr:patatin-like phospholipase family protein [Armatimonadota bacterium]MCX7777212.1 patatin-like phospholipase family protein [Armatimonadota bacterium]MDW8025039.1 patatin-like phospholipase family protein [Armatimonadota bacterium]
MRQLRLAVVFPGAASLGSYEAGAAFELARCALMARQLSKDKPPLIIDVVVGSSAGAITGALLSYILLTDGEPSWLYHAWVTHPQLSELILVSELNGVLSMRRLNELAQELLSQPYEPSENAEMAVRYVATLTNLTPLHYRIPVIEGRTLIASTHRDWKAMVLTYAGAQTPHGKHSWEYVAKTALASAAFPAIFPAQRLERSAEEYIANHVWIEAQSDDIVNFDFTDGGVMHNRPIALAFDALYEPHHIGLFDQKPIDDSEASRIVVVVSPREQPPQPTRIRLRPQPLMLDVLMSVISARFNVNDVFDDLRGAQKLNTRLCWKAMLLERMQDWLSANPDAAKSLYEVLMSILVRINGDMRFIRAQRDGIEKSTIAQRALGDCNAGCGVSGQHAGNDIRNNGSQSESEDDLSSNLESHSHVDNAIRLLNAVLDRVSGTTGKREVKIEVVSPLLLSEFGLPDELLCGEAMGHFAGFLSRRFRENDFRVGAECMRRWLCGLGELNEALRHKLLDESVRNVKVWSAKVERRGGKIIPLRSRTPIIEKKLMPISSESIGSKHERHILSIWLSIAILALRAAFVLLIDSIRSLLRRI